MGILTEYVMAGVASTTIKRYENLGYEIPKYKDKWGKIRIKNGTKIKVKVSDLPEHSTTKVLVQCDNCGKIINEDNGGIPYYHYKMSVQKNGIYYCHACAHRLYGIEKTRITKLIKGKSFAEYNIDILGEDFLEKYWDYKKNTINPYDIGYGSVITKVWIKCCNNSSHDSYNVSCCNFSKGSRCPICNISKGENKISNWLNNNNIKYESQKTFDELVGINNGLLSYDFYLTDYNLLIEYQGKQHEKPIKFKGIKDLESEKNFQTQTMHDSKKKQYAEDNNINLLEIWYYDFENIEIILENLLR